MIPAILIAAILYGSAWLSDGSHIGLGVGYAHGGPRIHMRLHDASGAEIMRSVEPRTVVFEGDSACVFDGICSMGGQHFQYTARVDDAHIDRVFIRVNGQPLVDSDVLAGNLIVRAD